MAAFGTIFLYSTLVFNPVAAAPPSNIPAANLVATSKLPKLVTYNILLALLVEAALAESSPNKKAFLRTGLYK